MEELEHSYTATRNVNGITVTLKWLEIFFKCKHIAAIWSNYSAPRYLPENKWKCMSIQVIYTDVHSSFILY